MPFITQGKTNLKYILILVILAVIVGGVVFFIVKSPAIVEAKELFTLYFDIDYVRKESALIFAELLEVKTHPERIGTTEEVGKPPPLSSREDLLSRLIENREEADRALESINEKSFSADDVSLRHKDIEIFYKQLADFEDFTIEELSKIKTQEQFSEFIDTVFELRPDWENLLMQDKAVLEKLTQLAAVYELEFEAVTYDELSRKRLVELRAPIISDEFGEVKYDFEIAPDTLQHNLSVSWYVSPVDQFRFSLKHPDGRIMSFEIIEPPEEGQMNTIPISYIPKDGRVVLLPDEELTGSLKDVPIQTELLVHYGETWVSFNFYPNDPVLAPIEGAWQLIVRAPGGIDIVLGSSGIPNP